MENKNLTSKELTTPLILSFQPQFDCPVHGKIHSVIRFDFGEESEMFCGKCILDKMKELGLKPIKNDN